MEKLKVICNDPNCMPERSHRTDAGLDLRAAKSVTLKWDTPEFVSTGIQVEIPEGFVGFVFARSGLAIKKGITLTNGVGVIDSGYRGEIICALTYRNPKRCSGTYVIKQYDRIAQLVITPIAIPTPMLVKMLSNSNRGEGGFGSTGNG